MRRHNLVYLSDTLVMISFNYAINHKTKSLQVYSQLDIHVYIFQRLEMLSIKLLFF